MGDISDLDRRIIAALQLDGRAPWAKIAAALQESERTISRRGSELLRSNLVRIRALSNPRRFRRTEQFVLKVSCAPGTASITAAALARRPETLYTYLLTGSADCAAEMTSPVSSFTDFLVKDIGSLPGVSNSSAYPVLSYFRTMHQWNPGILTEQERGQLGGAAYSDAPMDLEQAAQLTKEDRQILRALERDGRTSFEELSRLTGISVQTAQRRVERMRRDGTLYLRAVFEPSLMGLPVEVLLWVKVPFPDLENVGADLAEDASVRYAAVLAGDFQLLVDAVFPSRAVLYSYLKSAPWVKFTQSIEPAVVVEALKRSGTLALSFGEDEER